MIVDELKDVLYMNEYGIICRKEEAPRVSPKNCKEELLKILRLNEKNNEIDIKSTEFHLCAYSPNTTQCICSTVITKFYVVENKKSGNKYQVGCICVKNNFNEELEKEGKILEKEYKQKIKDMTNKLKILKESLPKYIQNKNEIKNNKEIDRLDESTEEKKIELEKYKKYIINEMGNFEFFYEKKKFTKFISQSGLEYIRNYFSRKNLPWNVLGEITYFIRYSECKTIKDFVENELVELCFEHPVCLCGEKKKEYFDKDFKRYKYSCPAKPNYCKVGPEYGFLLNCFKKPVLSSIQESINEDFEHRKRLIRRQEVELREIECIINKTKEQIEKLTNEIQK